MKVVSYMYNPLNKRVRRTKKVKKQLLLVVFTIGIGYIFFELQRILAGVSLPVGEIVGFAVIIVGVIILWVLGQRISKEEEQDKDKKLTMAIKKAFKEVGLTKEGIKDKSKEASSETESVKSKNNQD